MARIASATACPCETRTSTCRSLATASSGLCFLLAISVLLRSKAIPQDGPLQRGRIIPGASRRPQHHERDALPAIARQRDAERLLARAQRDPVAQRGGPQ